MRELLRVCLVPFVLANLIGHASGGHASGGHVGGDDGGSSTSIAATTTNSTTTTTTTTVTTAPLGNATCRSRTANYITHTLPQQCLRADRVAANATHVGSNATAPATDSTALVDSSTTVSSPASDGGPSTSNETATTNLPSTATQEAPSSTLVTSSTAPEAESDSPLDNANFLSFEEWKKQNLAKSGQSPENVGQGRNIEGIRERPINNALESYGEEGEIDLDFSGFGGESKAPRATGRQSQTAPSSPDSPAGELMPAFRSKDAGKTCKERTNYASFDCAANVLKSNPECKSSSSVLVENKDSYMLNTCSVSNKFFIVELCDDILIDTIVLANYEFFSSMFRHFRVSVSDRYPVKMEKWKELGTFEARNVREVQAFLVERPQIWARVLRIEFLSHYGSEYYCPVSLLRVHGTTMLEDYRHQEEIARGDHADEATLDVEVNATPALAREPLTSFEEATKETLTAVDNIEASKTFSLGASSSSEDTHSSLSSQTEASLEPICTTNGSLLTMAVPGSMEENSTCTADHASHSAETTARAVFQAEKNATEPKAGTASTNANATSSESSAAANETDARSQISRMSNFEHADNLANPTHHASGASPSHRNSSEAISADSIVSQNATSPNGAGAAMSANSTKGAGSISSHAAQSSQTSEPASSTPTSSTETTRSASASSTLATQPQPATQESFYKSVHKRLQQLESNSTLSLQYIEEQSRILRDAFSKVEKRQIAATSSFLTNLNATVMAELHGFRQAYDQLWQSTVIELEGQRETYQREMLAMGTRLTLVADELVWQKRIGVVQSTLLLLCLGLVLFARQSNGALEMPLMQQMVHRSQSALARAGWDSPSPGSPYASPGSRSPVSLFRKKLWRSHTEPVSGGSGEVTDATDSRPESKDGPEVVVAPPTPPAEEAEEEGRMVVQGGRGDGGVDGEEEDEAAEFEDVWETRSGPATPRGTREGSEFGEGIGWLDPGASGAEGVGLDGGGG